MTEKYLQTDRREAILAKARELFLAKGYHKTTMRGIAEAAEISTGPLYFYFRNKTEVFFYICLESFDYLISEFEKIGIREEHAAIRLRDIYYAYKEFYYKEPQQFEMMHLAIDPLAGIDLPSELLGKLKEKSQALIAIMEEVIKEGINRHELRPVEPRQLALYLYSVAEGIFLSSHTGMLQSRQVNLDEMIDAAINLIGFGMIES